MKLRSAGAGVALLDGVAPAALERGAEESLPERLPPAPAVVPPPPRTNICDASPATSMKDSSIPELGFFSVPKKVEKVRGSLERDSENKNSPMHRKGFLPSFSRVSARLARCFSQHESTEEHHPTLLDTDLRGRAQEGAGAGAAAEAETTSRHSSSATTSASSLSSQQRSLLLLLLQRAAAAKGKRSSTLVLSPSTPW